MLVRIPGSAQRYVDTATGETVSRRQAEKQIRPAELAAREYRYRERVQERRAESRHIRPEVQRENKRYWMQRYAEQYAVRHPGMTDREALEIAKKPGSEFNRLWARSEASGMKGGEGSAYSELAQKAGVEQGADLEGGYLARILWAIEKRVSKAA